MTKKKTGNSSTSFNKELKNVVNQAKKDNIKQNAKNKKNQKSPKKGKKK